MQVLDNYNACLQEEFSARKCWWVRLAAFLICKVDVYENNRKLTPSAGCSFLCVGFLILFDMGFFKPSVMGGGGGQEGHPSS